MPARAHPTGTPAEPTQSDVRKDLEKICKKHLAVLTRVSIERRRQGVAKNHPNRWLAQEVRPDRAPGESDDDLVTSIVDEVLRQIELDADGGAWLGKVHFYNDNAPKRGDTLLEAHEVRVDDELEVPTIAGESVAIVNTVGGFLAKMCDKMVALTRAFAETQQSNADVYRSLARQAGKSERAAGKWEYKQRREEQETEREKNRDDNRSRRASTRWAGIVELSDQHKDVVKAWSDMFLVAAKEAQGARVKPPTPEEIDAVFAGDERLDEVRKTAHEILAESEPSVRKALARKWRKLIEQLPKEVQSVLLVKAATALGEARARECFKWLSRPR